MRWETEWSFDGKLCQEYSYQKIIIIGELVFQVTAEHVEDAFLGHSVVYLL